MTRLFTTTRSLVSLQPGKEPRHDHGRRFGFGTQAMFASGRDARGVQADGDALGRVVYVACQPHVVFAGGRRGAIRGTASSSSQPTPQATQLSSAQYQRDLAAPVVGAGVGQGPVGLRDRRHAVQSGWIQDREHLQHGQSPATAAKRSSLRQAEARPQDLPQLHDGSVDHALGHAHSILAAALHAGVLSEARPHAPDHGPGGCRLDSRIAAARSAPR